MQQNRFLIVSNRLPITIEKRKDSLRFQYSAGGLTTGLDLFHKTHNSIWIGWCGLSDKTDGRIKNEIKKKLISDFNSHPLFLSKTDIEMYYHGFCNKTIWPLFQCFTQYTVYDKESRESYKQVNRFFCDAITEIAESDDTIWIHDYHLMLLPELIREKLPNAKIGFFLHIPFPSFEIFRLLPYRMEILNGLLGADLIGFHTYDYVQHFLDSVRRFLGYEPALGQITTTNRVVKVDSFPMGIDYERFATSVGNIEVQREISRIRKKVSERKIILSIDRLDYTKGILQRLEAFDLFLERNLEYKEKVTLILVAVPSRTMGHQYKLLKKELDELVGKINGKYGAIGWTPIWYLYRFLPFHRLVALYNVANTALVTPLRDGMNLIAKEFIAAKADGKGVLILSEMTGAAKELGEAIIVNPNNKEEIAEAIRKALIMSEKEQIENNRVMQKRLKRYNVRRWASDFMDSLSNIKRTQHELSARILTYRMKKKLIDDYLNSKKRLILLDYDGTLVPFSEKPERAEPDNQLLTLLKSISADKKNEIIIISGRPKQILQKWFDKLNMGLIAEHGAWIKKKGEDWGTIEPLRNDWKKEIMPILELYIDRTPNSFIEEKEFSLVWHHRRVDPELALVRSRELKDALVHLTANFNLVVLEGNKVIEIKKAGINKGRAALRWLSKRNPDFILALGDDRTDEDVFAVLPDKAYSFKVGLVPSKARFNLDSVKEVRLLLKELLRHTIKISMSN